MRYCEKKEKHSSLKKNQRNLKKIIFVQRIAWILEINKRYIKKYGRMITNIARG